LPDSATQLGQVALTFDDGPDADVTPKVLDILDRYGAKASFFCVGEKAAAHPNIIRDIVRRGHSVENHSMRHAKLFAFFGVTALRTDIGMTQSLLSNLAAATSVLPRTDGNPKPSPRSGRGAVRPDVHQLDPTGLRRMRTGSSTRTGAVDSRSRRGGHHAPTRPQIRARRPDRPDGAAAAAGRIVATGLKSVSLQTAMR
jgi:peptidoglycan/xylan/chitin deacetylase (PgdA/CDA1 family)